MKQYTGFRGACKARGARDLPNIYAQRGLAVVCDSSIELRVLIGWGKLPPSYPSAAAFKISNLRQGALGNCDAPKEILQGAQTKRILAPRLCGGQVRRWRDRHAALGQDTHHPCGHIS